MKALEWLLDRTGNAAVIAIQSDQWWRRALGLLFAATALWSCVALLAVWIVFGKKPHDEAT